MPTLAEISATFVQAHNDRTLQQNMATAVQVIQHVRSRVNVSTNYASTSSYIRRANGQYLYLSSDRSLVRVRNRVDVLNARYQARIDSGNFAPFIRDYLRQYSEIVYAERSGNCGEVSHVVSYTLAIRGITGIDLVIVRTAVAQHTVNRAVLPHAFVVIGRRGGPTTRRSILGNPDTWGPTAVVVDAWDRVAYPATQFATFWNGLRAAGGNHPLECMLALRV
jgi:hypothetical protein